MAQTRSGSTTAPAPERKMRPLPSMDMRPLPSVDALPSKEALSSKETSMEASSSAGAGGEVEEDMPKAAAKRRMSKKAPKGAAKVRAKRKSSDSSLASEATSEAPAEEAGSAAAPPPESTSEAPSASAPETPRRGGREPPRSDMPETIAEPAEGSVPSPSKSAKQQHEVVESRQNLSNDSHGASAGVAPIPAKPAKQQQEIAERREHLSPIPAKPARQQHELAEDREHLSPIPAKPAKQQHELAEVREHVSSSSPLPSAGASESDQLDGTSEPKKERNKEIMQTPEAQAAPVDDSAGGHTRSDQSAGHASSRKAEQKSAEKSKGVRRHGTAAAALSPVAEGNEEEEEELEERSEAEVEDGARYKGQWRGTQRHGKGQLVRRDGFKYEGNFSGGKAHGYGMFTSHQGMYEGEWANDRAHGQGKYLHADGSTYEGEWDYDNKHGAGEEAWADGSKYRGEFRQGLKHGRGTYRSASGVSYEGQFAEDRMDGYGIYMFPDGRTHIGQWRNGHMNGSGSMQWPNGCKYSGSYKDDLKHGEGSFKWPDGRAYHGQWHMGKQHGTGVLVNTEGVERRAVWHAGECVSCHPDSKATLQHITSATAAAALPKGGKRSPRAEKSPVKSPTKSSKNGDSDSDASSEDEAIVQQDPTAASRRANDLLLIQGAQLGRGATPNRNRRGPADKEARIDESKAAASKSGKSIGTGAVAPTGSARDREPPDHTDHDNLSPDDSEEESPPGSKSQPRLARTLPVDKDEVADGSRLVLKVPALDGSAQAEGAEEVSLRSPRAEATASGVAAATGKTALRPIPSLAAVHGEPVAQAQAPAGAGASASVATGASEEASKVAPAQSHAGSARGPETNRTEKKAPGGLSLIDMMASAVQSVEHAPVEEADEREIERSGVSENAAEQRAQVAPDGNRTAAPSQDQVKATRDEVGMPCRKNPEEIPTEDAHHDVADASSSARQREGSRPVLSESQRLYREMETPISYQDMMQWMYQLTIDPAVIQTLREESVSAVRCGCLGKQRPFFEVPKLNPSLRPSKDFVLNLALTDFDPKVPVHWRMLRTLHTTLTRSKESPSTGKHWEVLGFSGNDPCRDLNDSPGSRRFPYPGGVLNVIHIFFFLSHHVEALRHIYLTAICEDQGFKLFGVSMQITRMVLEALLAGKLTRLLNSDPSIWPDNSVYTMLCRVHNAGVFNFYTRWQKLKRRSPSTWMSTCQKVRDLMEAKPGKLLEEFRQGMRDLEASGADDSRHVDGGTELATESFISRSRSGMSATTHEGGGNRSPASSQTREKRQMSKSRH